MLRYRSDKVRLLVQKPQVQVQCCSKRVNQAKRGLAGTLKGFTWRPVGELVRDLARPLVGKKEDIVRCPSALSSARTTKAR